MTLVAQPLFMLCNAITQTITQSRVTLGVFTGLILPDQTLKKLEDRGQDLLDEVQGFGASTAFFLLQTPHAAAASVMTAPTTSGN